MGNLDSTSTSATVIPLGSLLRSIRATSTALPFYDGVSFEKRGPRLNFLQLRLFHRPLQMKASMQGKDSCPWAISIRTSQRKDF